MISVYEISPDYSHYTTIMPSARSFDKSNWKSLLKFDGRSKAEAWGLRRYCYIKEPTMALGDFAGLSIQCIAIQVAAFEKASLGNSVFRDSMEILPLVDEHNGTEWYALNILKIVDCTDRQRSELAISPYRRRIEFNANHLTSNVFKIEWPKSFLREIFCWESTNQPGTEFKARVEQTGLTGLEFELLWDENKGGRLFMPELDKQTGKFSLRSQAVDDESS